MSSRPVPGATKVFDSMLTRAPKNVRCLQRMHQAAPCPDGYDYGNN